MELLNYLLDILKFSVAGLIIFFVAWIFVKGYLRTTYNLHLIDLKKSTQTQTLPLRLQAYERMVIFLERLNPVNMLVRLHIHNTSARELQHLILADIRAEYQHNITQQLYVSSEAWQQLKRLKEDTISLVNNAVRGLPEEASAIELSKAILNHLSALDENPYDITMNRIKGEIHQLF